MVKKVLVIGSQKINFYELLKERKLYGKEPLLVEQAAWDDLIITSYSDLGIVVSIAASPKPLPNTPQNKERAFQPDFVLFRGGCKGDYSKDWSNLLLAFMHQGIPSLNSLDSFYWSQEKPLLYGKLLGLQRRLGSDKFPLIPQSFYPNYKCAGFLPTFPTVVKVGSASGGLGKMKVNDQTAWEDFKSVAAMQNKYVTSEQFVDWDVDIRIQKIGKHYRCFKRTSQNWKSNVGMSTQDEDAPVESRYKMWIDEAAKELGMDICAIDCVRRKSDGAEFILEINPSSIGLNPKYQDEDANHICDLLVSRMEDTFKRQNDK